MLYELGLHLYALFALCKGKKMQKRLGRDLPTVQRDGRPLVWIHAVSLGEIRAVAPLAKRLQAQVVISTVTQTGYDEALRAIPQADGLFFLPFDFSYLIGRAVKRLSPDLLIIVETDYWLNLQKAVQKQGGKVIAVNAKLSQRSFGRFSKIPFFAKALFGTVDHFCVQTEQHANWFAKVGVDSQKISVCGNLKVDHPPATLNKKELQKQLQLESQDFLLTLGSTHDPEETLWVEILTSLWKKHPKLKVFLVPRHPERFDGVADLLAANEIAFARWSTGGDFKSTNLILVDRMGVLGSCYQLSDLAFVGGTFAPKVGGHNLIEPALYGGVCTIYGPFVHAQPAFVQLMQQYGAGRMLSQEDAICQVLELVENREMREALAKQGGQMVADSRGALEKNYKRVDQLLCEKKRVC